MHEKVLVARLDDLPPGTLTKVEIADHAPIVVGNADGTPFAMQDECTHGEADLSEGEIVGCEIVCPLHSGCFDVRTGRATKRPAKRPQPTYFVEVVDGLIYVDLTSSSVGATEFAHTTDSVESSGNRKESSNDRG